MGALQFARSWYCAEWGGTVSLQVDSDYRHKQESFKPNEMCGSPRSRDTGLFCLIISLRQGYINRGPRQGYINRRLQQGATAWVHQQGASAGMLRQGHFSWGASAGALQQRGFGRVLQHGYINGGFGRGASTFSKYYEFPVTINGNIRLYCGTTRKRRQEKDYNRKQ